MVTSIKSTAGSKLPTIAEKPKPDAPVKGDSMFDKLDGNQVVNVVKAVAGLGQSVMVYRSEQEKTEQARINARVRLEEIGEDGQASERAYRNEARKIEAQAALHVYSHEEAMQMLQEKHGNALALINLRDRYMNLLESGKVTPQEFNAFLTALAAS